MGYRSVIGAEAHVQLNTNSKLFCSCSAEFGGEPNSRCCPVCLGFPGALPVMNRKAVEFTILTALALKCQVAERCRFARKNYFYPDLPKNYQISQYEEPIGSNGYLDVEVDGKTKRVRIRRVHLEEDTGKSIHTAQGTSLVDFNRCGLPLMEVVAEPDIETPQQARAYYTGLHALLLYLGVTTGSMEEGGLRCEPNVSVAPEGAKELGTKVELKNLNSFRSVMLGMEYEIDRQIEQLKAGKRIVQETRRWDEVKGITTSMRSKEWAHDYRYFPEPDLVPVHIDQPWLDSIRGQLPELPAERKQRFMVEYAIPEYNAALLVSSRALSDFFEECVSLFPEAKTISNWLMGDVSRLLNERRLDITQSPVSPSDLAEFLRLQKEGVVSGPAAKRVLEEMFNTGRSPSAVVEEDGLGQVSAEEGLLDVISQVLKENPDAVERFLAGKAQAKTFLVGQIMKATKGRANPKVLHDLLEKALEKAEGGI